MFVNTLAFPDISFLLKASMVRRVLPSFQELRLMGPEERNVFFASMTFNDVRAFVSTNRECEAPAIGTREVLMACVGSPCVVFQYARRSHSPSEHQSTSSDIRDGRDNKMTLNKTR